MQKRFVGRRGLLLLCQKTSFRSISWLRLLRIVREPMTVRNLPTRLRQSPSSVLFSAEPSRIRDESTKRVLRPNLSIVNSDVLKQGARFGSVACDARLFRRPDDVENFLFEQIEFFLDVQADAIKRDRQAYSQAVNNSFSKVDGQVVGWRGASSVRLSILKSITRLRPKFVRQNVREFRRSRARMSGLRSVVLWPVVALFYLSGLHQITSKARNFRNAEPFS